MDSLQDLAIHSLNVLSDEYALNMDTGSAVFNGGIAVKKNIISSELKTSLIETEKIKISDSLSVKNNAYIEGALLPFSAYSTGSIGTKSKQWNELFAINSHFQNMETVNGKIKNIHIDNLAVKTCSNVLKDNYCTDFTIKIDHVINTVYIESTVSARNINISIPNPDTGTNHDYKKVVFKQNKRNVITWTVGLKSFVSNNKEQIFDLINNKGSWEIIFYGYNDDVEELKEQIKLLSTVNTENLLDVLEKKTEIEKIVDELKSSTEPYVELSKIVNEIQNDIISVNERISNVESKIERKLDLINFNLNRIIKKIGL